MVVAGADTSGGASSARALAGEGAVVVLCGSDAAALGALAADLHATGARAAIFAGDASCDAGRVALAEMVSELFDARNPPVGGE